MNKINIPIASVCLTTVLILAGIGLFIPLYRASYDLETVILEDYQMETLSVGISEYTLSGIYFGDEEAPFFNSANPSGATIEFITSDSVVASRINSQVLIGGQDGDMQFHISGTAQRPLFPGSVVALRVAGKRVELEK